MNQKLLAMLGTKKPLPKEPTRMQVLSYNTHFMGGIIVDSPTYGKMPWWDSCLAWCDNETRRLAYIAKRAAKDTHAIIHIPNGKPLYNEWGQFYDPNRFGPLDWTNGETILSEEFDNLLIEVLEEGFYFHIAMDEIMEHSRQIIKLVAQRLKELSLTKYGFSMPGYDAVFYGWEPNDIVGWAADARAINPDILLGLEHDPGHIPLGGGPGDYFPVGRMNDFDIILGELVPHTPTTWQVLGRMIRPFYKPYDQGNDDPNSPFYLIDSPRGPRTYVAFESWFPYNWVRTDMNDSYWVQMSLDSIEENRNYFRSCGATFTG